MTENGYGSAGWRRYEDYSSLKKYINANFIKEWDPNYTHEILLHGYQLTTAADAEFQMTDSIAITEQSKTELTILGAMAEDNADNDDLVVTLVYKSNDGVSHTATCTVTPTHNDTEAAFLDSTSGDAVTDFYCCVSATTNQAVAAGDTFSAGATGALGNLNYCFQIAAETSAATEILMGGVGQLWGRTHTDNAALDDKICSFDYMTPWGEIKLDNTLTVDGTTSTDTEVQAYEIDGTTTVKDCYNIISAVIDTTPTGDTHEFFLHRTNPIGNVNGAGGDVPLVITEGAVSNYDLRFSAPESAVADVWLGKMQAFAITGNAIGDGYTIKIHLTPYGNTTEKCISIYFADCIECDFCIKLQPDTDCWYEIIAAGGDTTITAHVSYIWAGKM